MDKIIFGTKSQSYIGYTIRDAIPKFSLHLPTSHFKNLNPTDEEINQSSDIIERNTVVLSYYRSFYFCI